MPVDVLAMARATQIDTRTIYDVLGLPYDPELQKYVDRVKEAGSETSEEWRQAVESLIRYLGTIIGHKGMMSAVIVTSEEDLNAEEKAFLGRFGATPGRLISLGISRARAKSKIPWGTEDGKQFVSDVCKSMDLEDLIAFYKEVPVGTPEKEIVIKAMSRFFSG